MLMIYRANLRGNQLEWQDKIPHHLTGDEQVEVYVTVPENKLTLPERKKYGEQMVAALEKLMALPQQSITDPIAWEREQRQERALPKRPS